MKFIFYFYLIKHLYLILEEYEMRSSKKFYYNGKIKFRVHFDI